MPVPYVQQVVHLHLGVAGLWMAIQPICHGGPRDKAFLPCPRQLFWQYS